MTTSAKVVLSSVGPGGLSVTTLQLRYPKFIHGEFMTHRVFSRNASSSRAIPVERLIQDVIDDPVYPSFWGKNQPGMSAAEECDAPVEVYGWGGGTERSRSAAWDLARKNAIKAARAFAAAGYHKQIVNRLLEPFCHINVVVTSTQWSNFFALRCHPAAQPEMRELAEKMREVLLGVEPQRLEPGQWHLPYVEGDWPPGTEYANLIKLSVARCARVSYLTQDGKKPTAEEDIALYDRLVAAVPLHASPCEHQATPDEIYDPNIARRLGQPWKNSELHGNLRGFIQYRKTLPGECQ